jgi:hypothetical protein
LDFLGAWPFGCENARQGMLDFLGFPWILSSESRFFNGLRGQKRRKFFLALFRGLSRAREAPTVSGTRKRRIAHTGKLNFISIFLQGIVAPRRSLSAAASQNQFATARVQRTVDNAK